MFSVLLLALLPLAATAQCSTSAPDKCEKCGVGAIAVSFTQRKPCNCNDKAGYFGKMCGKTGEPTYPVCCSTDGKTATTDTCACGTRSCGKDRYCTAKSATDADAKCVYKTCASTDGSKAYTGTNQCQCGTTSCSKGQKCTATDTESKCESPKNPCKTTDGGDTGNTAGCECGKTVCRADKGKCTAASNTCVVPEQPKVDACKDGAEVTKACTCGTRPASIGQTCKDGKATWPACGSSAIAKYGLRCMCGTANTCSFGQKCLTSGANKDQCDCQASDDVVCAEKVPPSDKCPLDCAGHTTVGASGIPYKECIKYTTGKSAKYVIEDGKYGIKYFTGDDCETADSSMKDRETMTPGGCNGDSYVELPKSANSGAALKTMPIVIASSILASMFL